MAKQPFDYSPYDVEVVTPGMIKKMISVALEKGGYVKRIINAIQLVLVGIGIFILWRLQETAEKKHKQAYEYAKAKEDQDKIDDDDLD